MKEAKFGDRKTFGTKVYTKAGKFMSEMNAIHACQAYRADGKLAKVVCDKKSDWCYVYIANKTK